MSEFKSASFSAEDGSNGTDFVGVTTFTSPYYFVPPSGTTAQRPSGEGLTPGMLRFNTDIGRLEVWRGDHWATIQGDSPNLNGGARGVFSMGIGNAPIGSGSNIIDYVTISTLGNATSFGSATIQAVYSSACASSTRGIIFGGYDTAGNNKSDIQYFTISSTGNAASFGNLSAVRRSTISCSNSIRGIVAGGNPSTTNAIEYITISSTGNSVSFGSLTQIRAYGGGAASSTRGLFAGGRYDTPVATWYNVIDYVTISTTGNATYFGDLTLARGEGVAGLSNSTRGVFAGGNASPAQGSTSNRIDYVTIASTGNATTFGDMTSAYYMRAPASSSTRGLFAGGNPYTSNVDYIAILTIGNSINFGNLSVTRTGASGCSNGHGGL